MLIFGHVTKEGAFVPDNLKLYRNTLLRLADHKVQIEIDRRKTPRSLQQNAYLWGVVYAAIAEHTGDTVRDIHEICKEMFLKRRFKKIGKREVEIPYSTAQLTKPQFAEYLERIFALAGELGVTIQTPEQAGYISNYDSPKRP